MKKTLLLASLAAALVSVAPSAHAKKHRKKRRHSEDMALPKDKFSRSLPLVIYDAQNGLWTTIMDRKVLATRGYKESGSWVREGNKTLIVHHVMISRAPVAAGAPAPETKTLDLRYSLDDTGPTLKIAGVEGKIDETSQKAGIVGPVWTIEAPEAAVGTSKP